LGFLLLIFEGCSTIKAIKILNSATLYNPKNFSYTIPFDRKFTLIHLQASINGSQKKADFIFDTGAGVTVISKHFADSLNLPIQSTFSVKDVHGNISKNNVVLIPSLEVNGLVFKNVGAVVAEFGPNSALNCIGKDGIIGVNIISKCNWIVDYEKNTFKATDSDLHFPLSIVVVPLKLSVPQIPHIDIKLNGKLVKSVTIDMGSSETFALRSFVVKQNPGFISQKPLFKNIDNSSQGVNGTKSDTIYYFTADSLQVGDTKLFKPQTIINNSINDRIGEKLLEKYLVGFDYKNKKFYLSRNNIPLTDNTLHGFGFNIDLHGDSCRIASLFSNSPAADAGLKIDDEILEINGIPTSSFFRDYCTAIYWSKFTLQTLSEIHLKIRGKQEPITLKSAAYNPVSQ